MGFFRDQWNEIRPNLKYDLVKYCVLFMGAAILAALVRWIQYLRHAPHQDLLGYIILAVLIFIALIICTMSTVFHWRPKKADELSQSPQAEISTQVLKDTDLRGSVEWIGFLAEANLLRYNYTVLMKLRITNYGPVEATIVEWKVIVVVGSERSEGEVTALPSNLAIKRTANELFKPTESFELVDVDLKTNAFKKTFTRGVPIEGWIQFNVISYLYEPAINAEFWIYVRDSLGGDHWIRREAKNYVKDGEIVIRQVESILPLAKILMPPTE